MKNDCIEEIISSITKFGSFIGSRDVLTSIILFILFLILNISWNLTDPNKQAIIFIALLKAANAPKIPFKKIEETLIKTLNIQRKIFCLKSFYTTRTYKWKGKARNMQLFESICQIWAKRINLLGGLSVLLFQFSIFQIFYKEKLLLTAFQKILKLYFLPFSLKNFWITKNKIKQ